VIQPEIVPAPAAAPGGVLKRRRGIPRFANKVASGKPATIVAFGTSMTLHSRCGTRLGGRYLDRLLPRLSEAARNERITLHSKGLEGLPSVWAAYRTRGEVIPLAPDLVLLEFAHNDVAPAATGLAAASLHAIVGQIREVLPACEFATVLLQPEGCGAGSPSGPVPAHESVAELYGFPSFDLATLSERLVAAGLTTWKGPSETALTVDGVHHSAVAERLLGEPFAEAFVELLNASCAAPDQPDTPPPDEFFRGHLCSLEHVGLARMVRELRRANAAALRPYLDDGWVVGPAQDEMHARRNAAAYTDEIAVAIRPGASVRFPFVGTHAQIWALETGGGVRVAIDGLEQTLRLPDSPPASGSVRSTWRIFSVTPDLPDGRHELTLTAVALPLVLGDLFVLGEPQGAV
jgi:hypothetical protein